MALGKIHEQNNENINPYSAKEKVLKQKYEEPKIESLNKSKEAFSTNELEEIKEAELSEYESSTIDDRGQSNMVNASNTETSFQTTQHFELLQQSYIDRSKPVNLPILYIDIKISHDKISRLVLYKNQTPFDAAMDFIKEHGIPSKLQPYLIEKVQSHYDKI